jgi:hypothetical protein
VNIPCRISATLALSFACALALISADGQPDEHTFIAAVDDSGALLPFGTYLKGEWTNRWPWRELDSEWPTIPGGLRGIPADWLPPGTSLPTEWVLHLTSGAEVRATLTGRVRPSAWQFNETIALETDHRPERDPANLYDGEVLGIAIAGPGTLARFVRPPHREEQRMLRKLMPRLRRLERSEITAWAKARREYGGTPPERVKLSRARRLAADQSPERFSLHKASRPFNGRTYYFLEGEKLYSLGLKSQPHCMLNVSFQGLLVVLADGTPASEKLTAHPFENYCGDPAEWMAPLATFERDGRFFWIASHGVEDGSGYGVLDPTADDPWALVTLAGM